MNSVKKKKEITLKKKIILIIFFLVFFFNCIYFQVDKLYFQIKCFFLRVGY